MKKTNDWKWFLCHLLNLHKFDITKTKDRHIIKTCLKCNRVEFY